MTRINQRPTQPINWTVTTCSSQSLIFCLYGQRDPGHMTKMATTPAYGKILSKVKVGSDQKMAQEYISDQKAYDPKYIIHLFISRRVLFHIKKVKVGFLKENLYVIQLHYVKQ